MEHKYCYPLLIASFLEHCWMAVALVPDEPLSSNLRLASQTTLMPPSGSPVESSGGRCITLWLSYSGNEERSIVVGCGTTGLPVPPSSLCCSTLFWSPTLGYLWEGVGGSGVHSCQKL